MVEVEAASTSGMPVFSMKRLRPSSNSDSTREGSLLWYIENRDDATLLRLLGEKRFSSKKLNATSEQGQTPLSAACAYLGQNLDVIEAMIDAGSKLNKRGCGGQSVLGKAIQLDNLELVRLLLAKGADPNMMEYPNNETLPLAHAIIDYKFPIAEVLLDYHADTMGALEAAIRRRYLALIERLLDMGVNPLQREADSGLTMLHLAARCGNSVILDHFLPLHMEYINDTKNSYYSTPLQMIECYCRRSDDTECHDVQIARSLLEAGADVNLTNTKKHNVIQETECESLIHSLGSSAFIYALDNRLIKIAKQLLHHNPNALFWITPDKLSRALIKCDLPMLTLLLEYGADPNAGLLAEWNTFTKMPLEKQNKHHQRYRFGQTPLNYILSSNIQWPDWKIRKQQLDVACCLLFYGASPNISGVYFTPLHGLVEKFGTVDADVIVPVKMLVLCGLDIVKEQWLIERLHPGVPLGSPQLRGWLKQNILSPGPLHQCCLIQLRKMFGAKVTVKVPELPLPNQLKDYLLLKHLYFPPTVQLMEDEE